MEAIRKQASRLREQVARQQQAVFKQFGGYGGSDNVVPDDAEFQQHQKLEKLYISTRAAKHFQRDIVRGVEGYIVTGSKQVEIGTKLSEDSRKYGVENTCTSGSTLSKAASNFARARAHMEKERGNLLKALGTQVAEPLRAMVMGAPLEDARHLAQRYDRMRQEAEAQAVEVARRQAKLREGNAHPDMAFKLEAAESKLQDLKSNVATLGKEAAAAMAAVEAQQQRLTLQRLISMVESERAYHQRVLQILDQLEGEMMSERQRIEPAPTPPAASPNMDSMPAPPSYEEVNSVPTSPVQNGSTDGMGYFLGEVMYPYQAESDVELTLSVGEFVVIRKVSNNGWAEGESRGKAGWFPFGYIERRDRVLASKDRGQCSVTTRVMCLCFFQLLLQIWLPLLLLDRCFGPWALTAFTGANNPEIIAAANTYVQIRGLAWPAVLIGWVAQSASLGMKDSWGPLKALVAASAVNGIGDIVLCRYLGYGIAGAAWATMVSQVVAAYMMVEALNNKGYNGFALSRPSPDQLLEIFMLAAPVFLTMMSKVMFYSLLVYFATSMGTKTLAAHQVMIQVYCVFTVFGEPLSQTAQSFLPEMIHGVNRDLAKARTLLKSLIMIGILSGLILGTVGVSIPWLFPRIFSPDSEVVKEMHKVLIPYFLALFITPATHSLEGTLMAGRDLKFISMSMTGIFGFGSLILLLLSSKGYGLAGCWFTLVAFQWSRFSIALRRLTLPTSFLYSEDLTRYQMGKMKTV